MKKIFFVLLLAGLLNQAFSQSDPVNVECWLTKADRSALFERQHDSMQFTSTNRHWGIPIIIDVNHTMQVMDGFGFALTGGSAELMMKMSKAERAKLVKKLFSTDGDNAGISYIRLSIGASDMNSFVFSYDDLPAGQTDFNLDKFSLAQDMKDVVPVMKQVLAINPSIRVLGSPWSAPTWMKTNNAVKKGFLKTECYDVYARYFVKYIEAMKKEGIVIDAVTIQNEPLNANNTPSMPWYPKEAGGFIKNNLGPAFKKAGIDTKIILFDHNCDRPDYPLSILSDPEAAQYVDGSGFHLYGGDISALSIVHTARPDKNIYFTEQMTVEKPGAVPLNITDPVKRLIIEAPKNWSKNVILWNLAADSLNKPHTNDGGCPMCQGAVTIDGDKVGWNIAYYAVAHASKFVRPGSVRIASTAAGDAAVNLTRDEELPDVLRSTIIGNADVLPNVAFKTPQGKIVLIVANDKGTMQRFSIQYKGMIAVAKLDAGAVATYVWQLSE
ncbi:MAG: glycoside hydrolase family 30 beta sandwich domain-containing protein [Ferruginibacter sp.]